MKKKAGGKRADAKQSENYLKALNIHPAHNYKGIESQLTLASSRSTAKEIIKALNERGERNGSDNASFYKIKNQTLDISLAISSAFDGDILANACGWIVKHKKYFGPSILEVGCDCGIMSCFLARTFPEAHITAIDRCREGIENAKLLAERLGVKNVDFICADLNDIWGFFDTVFSMRTVHENLTDHKKEDVANELEDQALLFEKSLASYAGLLSSRLAEEGVLVSMERIGRNALMLGWMRALENAGISFHLKDYEEIKCIELSSISTFEAYIGSKKTGPEELSVFEKFIQACGKYINYTDARYYGWDAKIVFNYKRGELIEGYKLVDPTTKDHGTMSVWTHKFDKTGLIFYQNYADSDQLLFYDIESKDELVEKIRREIDTTPLKVTKM